MSFEKIGSFSAFCGRWSVIEEEVKSKRSGARSAACDAR